jgi:hypothetical protein
LFKKRTDLRVMPVIRWWLYTAAKKLFLRLSLIEEDLFLAMTHKRLKKIPHASSRSMRQSAHAPH